MVQHTLQQSYSFFPERLTRLLCLRSHPKNAFVNHISYPSMSFILSISSTSLGLTAPYVQHDLRVAASKNEETLPALQRAVTNTVLV